MMVNIPSNSPCSGFRRSTNSTPPKARSPSVLCRFSAAACMTMSKAWPNGTTSPTSTASAARWETSSKKFLSAKNGASLSASTVAISAPRFQHPFRVTSVLLKATAWWEEKLWACAAEGEARKFLDWFRDEGNDRYFDGVGALALLLAAGGPPNGTKKFTIQRTYYEQWFTERDASAVTFSSGRVLA